MDDATTMPPASILVIDDDTENLKLVGGLLSERGYTVRLVPQAQMALRSAQAQPPDLVLLDIRLPDMDGYAVCAALKADACTHEVPVIFCSALGETIDKVRAFEVGGVDYIAKPFDLEEVLARVATHIALRRMQRQLQQQYHQLQQEVAERKRVEVELRDSHQRLATLLSASQQLAAKMDIDRLPERILDQLARVVDFTAAAVGTLDGDTVEIQSARSFERDLQGLSFSAASNPFTAELVAARAPISLPDVQSEPAILARIEALTGARILGRSWLGVPLVGHEQVIGILYILHNQVDYFRQIDQQRVQIFANLAGVAIENARLSQIALTTAVLEERSRIARDLHDAVSQSLFAASLIADALRENSNLSAAKQREGLNDLRQLTRGAQAEMRALLYELHPGGLAEKPLGELLGALCTAFTSRTRIPVALTVTGTGRLQAKVPDMLYRITQEALNNITKHAAADAARVALTCSPEEVVLVIADDGRGFEMSDGAAASPGMGIGSMRDRASSIGALLRIDSQLGAGTTVTVVWRAPVAQPAITAVTR